MFFVKFSAVHTFSHKFSRSIGAFALGCMLIASSVVSAEIAGDTGDVGVERDADRIIRELRDTTLMPVLDELRLNWVRLGDPSGDQAHWFFGLDTVFWVDGRHDAVSWNTGSRSRSMEQTVGVNQRAYAAMRQGKLYTLGGTGIYREHANLFVFNVLMGWDLVKVVGDEPPAVTSRRVVERDGSTWMVLGSLSQQLGEDEAVESAVWELDLLAMEWRKVGAINGGLLRQLGDFRAYSTGGYAAIYGVGTGGIYHPQSGMFVELENHTISRLPKFDAYGGRDTELFWFSRSRKGNWTHERMDLKALFDAGKGQPLLGQGEDAGFPGMWWWVVGGLVMGGLGWLGLRSKERSAPDTVPAVAGAADRAPVVRAVSDEEDESDWDLVVQLLAQNKRLMNAQEMNALLGIGEGVSDDSSRSRRARAIRRMNAAFERRHGVPFITRERDVQDRRHLLYKVNEIPQGNA